MSIAIRAPSRMVEMLAIEDGEFELIKQWNHPIGTFACTIDRPELLQLDKEGGLRIAIRVSDDDTPDPEGTMSQAPWKIEQLQLTATGTVLEPSIEPSARRARVVE